MPDITSSVGVTGSANKVHDVALVQAMLRVIKKEATPYLAGNYDGVYGNQTKAAISKFQTDNNLVDKKGIDKAGKLMPNGETIKKLNAMVPASHKTMHIIANTKTVYLEGNPLDTTASGRTVLSKQNLENNFKHKVFMLVWKMFEQHKIVLKVTNTGWRRTFAEQAQLRRTNPRGAARPGESNHNYGRAVDIGFEGLKWLRGDGTIVTDSYWLNRLEGVSRAKATAFWDARDAIALKAPISLFRLQFERIHLQSYNQATASSSRSLAKLLNTVGTMKWAAGYKSDLGGGKKLFPVGNAEQIWAGNTQVSKAELAAAKGVSAKTIIQKDIKQMQKALKADFELADQNWKKWVPVP